MRIKTKELVLFALFGTLMFGSDILMEFLPNVHIVGVLTVVYTIVYRVKALIPIYVYVLLNGVFAGFAPWWVPHLYLWTVLWGVTMLLPKKMSVKVACVVYTAVCALHGFAFGILYAPGQAIMYGFDLQQTVAWIAAGFPFDIIHGISNFFTGLLVIPLAELLRKISGGRYVI